MTGTGQFAFLLVVLLAVTGEYSTGAIRSTLQWVPRRGVLFSVRALVPVLFATACSVVVFLATDLVAWTAVFLLVPVLPIALGNFGGRWLVADPPRRDVTAGPCHPSCRARLGATRGASSGILG